MADMNFLRRTTVHDTGTDRVVPSDVTIPGKGARVSGDPKVYEALKLRVHEAATVKWGPLVYGQQPDPEPGDTTTFEGRTWTIVAFSPLKPDGVLIYATVVLTST